MTDEDSNHVPQLDKTFDYTPIKALSSFTYDWRLKARVIKKADIKFWKNQRSEGQL